MVKWEYQIINHSITMDIKSTLNKLGQEGWELVSVIKNEYYLLDYFLKRQLNT